MIQTYAYQRVRYISASFAMQAKGRVKKFIDRALATADAFWRH